jgi:PII-like signaling protein
MQTPGQAVLLRIYTDEQALLGDQSLIDVIVRRAQEARLAGITVLRGLKGFGAGARLHQHRTFALSDNLPVVIEIVEEEDKLRAFVQAIDDLPEIGLVTFEKVEVLRYGGVGAASGDRSTEAGHEL